MAKVERLAMREALAGVAAFSCHRRLWCWIEITLSLCFCALVTQTSVCSALA